jgi:hypothetical protein
MTRTLSRTILSTSFALLAGCSSFAKLTAPSLEGGPETTGMVVVEPDITFYANTIGTPYGERLIGGALARADDPKHVVQGRLTSGLVVFSNLTPGTWRLTLIEGQLDPAIHLRPEDTMWRRHYEVPPELAESFTFEVRAGEVVYAGAGIVDDDRAQTRGVRMIRQDDPAAEQQAWKRMADLYGTSSWGSILHARVGSAGH